MNAFFSNILFVFTLHLYRLSKSFTLALKENSF